MMEGVAPGRRRAQGDYYTEISKSLAGSLRTLCASALNPRAPTALCVLVLLAVNVYIVRDLFSTAYISHMGSIEGTHIALGRQVADHWGDLTWFPLWYAGIPFQNTYPPLLPLLVAALAQLAAISPALSYHAVTAAFYCLGPVTLFWMAYRLSGSRFSSFAAALLYSVFSPSVLLVPAVRADIGSIFNPRRFEALVRYGEGPHVTSMTLLPVAIVCLHTAIRKRSPAWYLLTALAMVAVVLTNWLGGFALAAAVVAYLLSRETRALRNWALAAGIGCYAYLLASPWIPPSTLRAIRRHSEHVEGTYTMTLQHLKYLGLLIVALVLADLWFERRRISAFLRFALLFSLFMGAVTLAAAYWGVSLVPQPERYHLEMEMGLSLALLFALKPALDELKGRSRAAATLGFLLFCFFQMKTCRGFAAYMDRPIDIQQTSEFKAARWFDEHMKGQRVMAAGSIGFWLNVFTDVPQLAGGFDQGVSNPLLPHVLYQIYSGDNAGIHEAEYAVLWLKAFGVHAVAVSGPGGGEYYKPFRNPKKFDSHLKELWRDGGDVVYEVPSLSQSLAHVVPRAAMVAREPAGGLDVEPLRTYVAALDDPALPAAAFRWESRRRASITADLQSGQALSVQVTYNPGWHASVDGQPRRTYRDKLGLLAIEPACEGPCQVELDYDGGLEMRLARLFSWGGLAAGLAWIAWRRAAVSRK